VKPEVYPKKCPHRPQLDVMITTSLTPSSYLTLFLPIPIIKDKTIKPP